MRRFELPSFEEILHELPHLLMASGALTPRPLHGPTGASSGPPRESFVLETLSSPWSNVDFEPELGRFDALERAFVERQIARCRRLEQLGRGWVLKDLEVAQVVDWSVRDGEEPYGMLALEVPVLTTDRKRAVLRGQRCESHFTEDFERYLERIGGRWTS